MIVFILANSPLELIPRQMWHHPAIRKWAKIRNKKPSEMILDASLHFSAIRDHGLDRNRGRLDILHRALLTILDTDLCKEGLISEIVIHTINKKVYSINPQTRLPRHYFRFIGLMEKLLLEGEIQASNIRLIFQRKNLEETLKNNNVAYTIGFSRRGKQVILDHYFKQVISRNKNIAIVVGAFAHGFFSDDILQIIDNLISIGKRSYTTSYVLCKIINSLERILIP